MKPTGLHWYQFRLRSLMIFAALFAVCCSVFMIIRDSYVRLWRSPQTMSNGNGFNRNRDEHQHVECLVWQDHYGDLFYAIVAGYVDFDPNLPECPCSYAYNYDIRKGGHLKINDRTIEFSPNRRLLALNPFGQMEEIVLSLPEQEIVSSGDADRIWNEVVLVRLYKRQGKVDAGHPVGHWTYSDGGGKLAYEGFYQKGKRNGKWTYYYNNGNVRSELNYVQGKLDGESKYFNSQGKLTKTIKWKNDYPDQTVQQNGLIFREIRTPTTTSSGKR